MYNNIQYCCNQIKKKLIRSLKIYKVLEYGFTATAITKLWRLITFGRRSVIHYIKQGISGT